MTDSNQHQRRVNAVNAEQQSNELRRRCRSPIRGVLVAAGVILAGVLTLAACGDDDDSGGRESAISLIGADADGEDAFAMVESAFAAFNSGDMDTWALRREGSEAAAAEFDYDLAAESRMDIEQCTYRGLATWDSFDGLTGHGFDCDVTQTDRILQAAGIELEMIYNWVIDADLESSLGGSNEDFMFVGVFLGEYRNWLATSHPDVEASIDYAPSADAPTAGSVPTALEYVDEFVAQSDLYPLTEPVPEADYYGGPLS